MKQLKNMYYRIIDEKTNEIQVYFGNSVDFASKNGFYQRADVEQCETSGRFYLSGYMPQEEKANDVRAERDFKLTATDIKMLPDYPIDEEVRQEYKDYRQYLRDIPEDELFPDIGILDFDTWKNNRRPVKKPG